MSWLDEFWGDLLSEEPLRITAAWLTLDAESQQVVNDHLYKMATDKDYTAGQAEAARFALDVLNEDTDGTDENPAAS